MKEEALQDFLRDADAMKAMTSLLGTFYYGPKTILFGGVDQYPEDLRTFARQVLEAIPDPDYDKKSQRVLREFLNAFHIPTLDSLEEMT